MDFRKICDPELVDEFSQATKYNLDELKILKEVTKKMLRVHNLDIKSRSYFEWLDSCIDTLSRTLWLPRELKHKADKYGTM